MTTFKKGDKFIPRKPKVHNTDIYWISDMNAFEDMVLTVHEVTEDGYIKIRNCRWSFHPDWCEKVGDSEIPNNHIPEVGKVIDWDYWRNEFAKSAMQGLLATGWNIYEVPNLVGKSIEIADEMLKQLKAE